MLLDEGRGWVDWGLQHAGSCRAQKASQFWEGMKVALSFWGIVIRNRAKICMRFGQKQKRVFA